MKSWKLLGASLMLAATLCCVPVPATFAEEALPTQKIIIVDDATTTVTMPEITVEPGKDFDLRVDNPTSTTAWFAIPEVGVNEYIPWFSTKTINLPAAKVANHKKLTYTITDGRGERNYTLANGVINIGNNIPMAGDGGHYAEFTANAQRTIEEMVRKNDVQMTGQYYIMQDSYSRKTETYSPEPTTRRSVRGYW